MPGLEDLMKAGVHFGHRRSKWHPKMEPFIFTEKNDIHIINLEKTQTQLEKALGFLTQTVAAGGTVLFLGTKKQAQDIVKEGAIACNMPYIVYRWLGGTMTNANSVLGLVKKYRKLKEDKASGALKKFTKKEQLNMDREIIRLDTIVGGLENMDKLPQVVVIVDIKTEKTALNEAIRKEIPVVAVCDTNVNPELVDYPVPANDDATSSIKMIVNLMVEAVKEGQQKKGDPVAQPKAPVVEKKQVSE